MFATQVKSQCKTRPTTTATHGERRTLYFEDDYNILQKKIKNAKEQAKQMEMEYNIIQSNVNNIQKTIDLYRHKTCEKRLHFLKTYTAKKIKIQQNQLKQLRKTLQFESLAQKRKHSKIIKLNNELHRVVIRCEEQRMKQQLRLKNKAQKQMRRSRLIQVRNILDIQTKLKHEKIREHSFNLAEKKSRIAMHNNLRSQQNYKNRKNLEIELIKSFDNLLKQAKDYDEMVEQNQESLDNFKTFFLTNNRETIY